MITLYGVLFFMVAYTSVASALPPCVCTRDLKPVCGSDGVTYNNKCLLDCQMTKDATLTMEKRGRCDSVNPSPSDCICTLEYRPICGSDGKTYPNRCALNCEKHTRNVDESYEGQCRVRREDVKVMPFDQCKCTREARPVCGTDGLTYASPCLLNCARESNEDLHINHSGACNKEMLKPNGASCTCTRNLQPVCASNGMTYSNECLMKCADENLTVEKPQPCEF